jgi:hypothetical protein
MTDEPRRGGEPGPPAPEPPDSGPEDEGFWSAYWERFRRQQVDDPVPGKREGMWDRFRRQDVDDPVGRRSGE